jgi:hypothetical protein
MLIKIGSGELFTLAGTPCALKLIGQLKLENSMRKATRIMQTTFPSFITIPSHNSIQVGFYGLWKIWRGLPFYGMVCRNMSLEGIVKH